MRGRTLCLLGLLAVAAGARAETLTLEQCLQEVARNDPALEVQRSLTRAAAGTRLSLHARALPNLRFGLLAGQQGDEGTSIARAGDLRDSGGKVVAVAGERIDRGARFFAIGSGQFLQPIFDTGIPPAWRRGNLELTVARANFVATASAELHAARLLFYEAVYLRESGRIYGEMARQLDENATAIGDLFKAGLQGRQAFLQAQVQRSNLDLPIFAQRGSYQTSLAALWRLMGRPGPAAGEPDPLGSVTLEGSLADAQPPEFDPAQVAPAALARRPDLQSLREVIEAYREDARIVRAGYYPVVQLIATGQVLPQNFVRSERPNSVRAGDAINTNEVRFGARYSWLLIDTGAVQGAAQRTDRTREGLEAALRQLEQDVPRDLALLKASIASLRARAEAYAGNVATAADTLKIILDATRQGSSSQLEVIDAQNGALSAQIGLLTSQWQTRATLAEFDRITGGYVRLVDETAAAPPARGNRSPAQDR